MLVLKLELHNANDNGRVTELGRVCIANDATGNSTIGNYVVRGRLREGPSSTKQAWHKPTHIGRVDNYHRDAGAWPLVAQALAALGLRVASKEEA